MTFMSLTIVQETNQFLVNVSPKNGSQSPDVDGGVWAFSMRETELEDMGVGVFLAMERV